MFLTTGGLLILFGFAQFVVFMGLDGLGVIEVGNALGLGLLLWISVAVGFLLLLLGLLLAALLGKAPPSQPQVPGSPFDSERL